MPKLRLTTGGVDYDFPMLAVERDAEKRPLHMVETPRLAFPDPVPQTGAPLTENYGPVRKFELTPPFHVGVRRGADPHGVWDGYDIDARWSQVTPAPLRTTTTQPGGAIQYNRFQERNGELYALSRRTTLLSGQTGTKLYFHTATDDRSISGLLATIAENKGDGATIKTMNATIGAAQVSSAGIPTQNNARFGQFVSPPLASQTIAAQNITLNIARSDTAAASGTEWGMRLYVYRPSNQTVVGYILGSATAAVQYSATSVNTADATEQSFQDSAFSGSAVTCQDGDILVCEVYVTTWDATGNTQTLYYDGTTETTSDNTTVSNHASFINFASNLTFSGAVPAKVAGRLAVFDNPSTWTDTTVDTDTGLNYPQAVERGSERILALSAFVFGGAGGQDYTFMVQSWDGLVWAATGATVQNNFIFLDMVDVAGSLYILYCNDASYPTWWRLSTVTGVNFATVTTQKTVASKLIPHFLVSYPNAAGTEKPWVSAGDGIYLEDARVIPWTNPASTCPKRLLRSAQAGPDALFFCDGPDPYMAYWTAAGILRVDQMRIGIDGVPTEALGDIQDMWIAERWLFCAKGGDAASRNARVYVLDLEHPKTDGGDWAWRPALYRMATANRQIRAVAASREDDGTSRLHVAEDNGTANDSDLVLFPDILENPINVSGHTYGSASGSYQGVVRATRFNARNLTLRKAFDQGTFVGDGFSANETLSVKFASNGGSLGSAQSVTSSPTSLWTDGSSTAIGTSALDMDMEITLLRGSTNTNAPKVSALSWDYQMPGLKSDGTPVLQFAVRISLNREHYTGQGGQIDSPGRAWNIIETLAGTVTLLSFVTGQHVTTARKVRLRAFKVASHIGEMRSSGLAVDEYGYADLSFTEEV